MINRTISHYTILEKLGEGGMGVVWKARDTELNRFVAIKALSSERTADPERRARFIQEAQAASALNHPNIITIHDVLHHNGADYIVMEFVAGKALDHLIPRKGMRLAELLRIAAQVADALACAHLAGIIHRDLKPANVMVGDDGRVRLLDFGLAKLTEVSDPSGEAPTRTVRASTEEGQVFGTVSYMSPEQAEGRKIDPRSDIFSFGTVLYEMVTGHRPFQGNSSVATLAAIIREDPAPLPQDTPYELQRLIERCLRKDPDRRLRSMADVKLALEDMKEETESGRVSGPVPGGTPAKKKRTWMWAGLAAAVALLVFAWVWKAVFPGQPEQVFREVPFVAEPGSEWFGNFSPDGSTIAFAKLPDVESWQEQPPATSIQLKMIGADGVQLLKDGGMGPVWSSDGRWIAYLTGTPLSWPGPSGICVMPRIGGSERRIAEVRTNRFPDRIVSWTPDGKWLVSMDQQDPKGPYHLVLVSVESGEKRRLTTPRGNLYGDTGPALSPGGKTLAFTRHKVWGQSDLYLLDLDANLRPVGEPRLLKTNVPNANCAVWTLDGKEIVFCSRVWHASTMWRIRADGSGTARPLAFGGAGAYAPDIARTGNRLVYTKHVWDPNIWRVELDPSGRPVQAPERFIQSSLSDFGASWSPDGKSIAFGSDRSGTRDIWLSDATGANPRQLTTLDSSWGMTPYWSPDSEWIAFEADSEGNQEIYVVSARGGKHRRLTSDPARDYSPQWSLDGKWIYFNSNRGGQTKVWKVAPQGGDARPADVSRLGIHDPGGSSLYYTKQDGAAYSLWREPAAGGQAQKVLGGMANSSFAVSSRGVYFTAQGPEQKFWKIAVMFHEFSTGKSTKIADVRWGSGSGADHSVSPDGRYLLYTQSDRETNDLMLVENFR